MRPPSAPSNPLSLPMPLVMNEISCICKSFPQARSKTSPQAMAAFMPLLLVASQPA